mgnify:CR=1 FL=1
MIKEYDFEVSDEEFLQSPLPTKEDQVALAQSLGLTISSMVPILICFMSTSSYTPNARLRWMLNQTYRNIREDRLIYPIISNHDDILDEEFIRAVERGENSMEDSYSEENLGGFLLNYAVSNHKSPNELLSERIGRSKSLIRFTKEMSHNLSKGKSIPKSLLESSIYSLTCGCNNSPQASSPASQISKRAAVTSGVYITLRPRLSYL